MNGKNIIILLALASVFPARAEFEVYLMRHGETTWNREKRLQGSIAHPDLTEKGVKMAEESAAGFLRRGIKFDAVYSSPYRRARHTAEIIADAQGLVVTDDQRLRERTCGSCEGRYYADSAALARMMAEADGVESVHAVGDRMMDFLKTELAPLDGKVKRVLCVAHSLLLNSVEARLSGADKPGKELLPNCCVHVLEFAAGAFLMKERAKIFYPEKPKAVIGLLSDVHLKALSPDPDPEFDVRSVETFRRALEWLDSEKADGVVVSGDLTQLGMIPELKKFAAVWESVFPGNRRRNGEKVEPLFIFGDHDVETFSSFVDDYRNLFRKEGTLERHLEQDLALHDRAKQWEACFHEPFAPIRRRTVKGYDFVLAHLDHLDVPGMRHGDPLHIPGLEEFFATNRFDNSKPFFYVQHKIPKGTVGGPTQTGQDDGRTTAILSRYPNAVAFCGHKHRSAVEELSLWQGAFTTVQLPALQRLLTAAGRENSRASCEAACATPPQQMEMLGNVTPGAHAMLMKIYEGFIVIERVDAEHGFEPVADPWTMRLPNDGSAAYAARRAVAKTPAFAEGAKAEVKRVNGRDRAGHEVRQLEVSFPPAVSPDGTRAYDYEVTPVLVKGVVERRLVTKRVYSPNAFYPPRFETDPVVCRFAFGELSDNHDTLRFEVRPLNAWGDAGGTIETEPAAFDPAPPQYAF